MQPLISCIKGDESNKIAEALQKQASFELQLQGALQRIEEGKGRATNFLQQEVTKTY